MPAIVKKVRRLVNPTVRRKKPARRKPTARNRSASVRPRKTHARPKARPTARKKAAPKRKRNPVAVLGAINPRKRKGANMKKNTPKRRPAARKQRPRRKNPSPRAAVKKGADILKTGAFALGGLVLTRQIPQAFFAARNTGVVGYLMNIVVALVAAGIVGKFSGKANGQAVGIGGGLYTFERIMSEQLTPLGKALSLSGVGDARAHGGLAGIQQAYFPWPVVTDRSTGQPVIPREITQAAIAAMPPPATGSNAGMGRLAGRF